MNNTSSSMVLVDCSNNVQVSSQWCVFNCPILIMVSWWGQPLVKKKTVLPHGKMGGEW